MNAAAKRPSRVTFNEFLTFEETSTVRHELIGGVLFAMSGGSDTHNLICGNLFLHIAGPLIGKCQTFQGQMKLRVTHQSESDGYYPDVMVTCSTDDRERLYRRHPVLLVEVLSPTTARFDRGEKRLNYLQIPSLVEYVLVSQDIPRVEVMRRRDAWATEDLFMGDALVLDSVGLTVPVADIYQMITF